VDKDHLSFNELGFNNVEEAVKVTPFVYLTTFIIAIGGFMYGYNSGVISGAMLLLENDIPMTSFQKGLVVGVVHSFMQLLLTQNDNLIDSSVEITDDSIFLSDSDEIASSPINVHLSEVQKILDDEVDVQKLTSQDNFLENKRKE
ncbi:4692_t:CDS:2, partial [Dentiscutata heterogama]